MAKTRKVKAGAKVLKVDAKHKIPEFEAQIKAGTINFVLVYADWCGACHRFMDNIWNPMCKGKAKHNRLAVRDDMIKGTSLANANFDYLPSVLIVDEAGELQSFKTPEGKDTNAMPTPKSLGDMKRIVNVPVSSVSNRVPTPFVRSSSPTRVITNMEMPNIPSPPPSNRVSKRVPNQPNRLTTEELPVEGTPAGVTYRPTPMVAPQKGGKRRGKRNVSRSLRFPKEFMRRFGLAFTRRIKGKN
jgi:hypothetical protein